MKLLRGPLRLSVCPGRSGLGGSDLRGGDSAAWLVVRADADGSSVSDAHLVLLIRSDWLPRPQEAREEEEEEEEEKEVEDAEMGKGKGAGGYTGNGGSRNDRRVCWLCPPAPTKSPGKLSMVMAAGMGEEDSYWISLF